ncbi:hypothetical protein HPB49_017908 [Dermacentor silvarum]|uniref:Uncharacterized protein n=1 Tax=Dermacentor silvarum TaxID=543639 RepID=A0ACB8E1F8_DERSI|nr:uncharacterized protein LOC119466007 [Dermacentor silvarum]KAH7980644.1 hypothetical protein HPB49_017908 [Dermacentor silvarum]
MAHLDKLSTKELEDILCQLCTDENIKVAASGDDDAKKNLAKSAGSAIGGKMLNKLGGFGSMFGGGSKDGKDSKDSGSSGKEAEMRPAADVIRELPDKEKDNLADTIQSTISKFGDFKDPQALLKLITENAMVKQLITSAVKNFLGNFLKTAGGGAA